MRTAAIYLVLAVAAAADSGCLHSTEFKCHFDSDCGATGMCESIGYCSVPNTDCAGTQRSYSDSAGQGLSNTCVPGSNPGRDAGIDTPVPIDGPIGGCPAGYAAVAGSAHRYKALTNVSWDTAKTDCKLTSPSSAYLAVPDDLTELMNLATVANTPFWIGIDDQATTGTWVTQKGVTATYLPWLGGQPGPPTENCVEGVSSTAITTDKCGTRHAAVCECEP